MLRNPPVKNSLLAWEDEQEDLDLKSILQVSQLRISNKNQGQGCT